MASGKHRFNKKTSQGKQRGPQIGMLQGIQSDWSLAVFGFSKVVPKLASFCSCKVGNEFRQSFRPKILNPGSELTCSGWKCQRKPENYINVINLCRNIATKVSDMHIRALQQSGLEPQLFLILHGWSQVPIPGRQFSTYELGMANKYTSDFSCMIWYDNFIHSLKLQQVLL